MFKCALYDHLAESRRNVAGKGYQPASYPPTQDAWTYELIGYPAVGT